RRRCATAGRSALPSGSCMASGSRRCCVSCGFPARRWPRAWSRSTQGLNVVRCASLSPPSRCSRTCAALRDSPQLPLRASRRSAVSGSSIACCSRTDAQTAEPRRHSLHTKMYAHTACAVVIVAARSDHVSPSEGTRAGSALASSIPGRKPPRAGTMVENEQQARPGTEVHLDEWVPPEIADENGYIRAGTLLELLGVVVVLA